jgi:glyoxylase-like metal-dependent hydrolase (beta-lactamase superfamily II)
MNDLEHQLHYPFADALPEPGSSREVAPGVRWIRMALPFALNHINLWLLRDQLEDPRRPGQWIEGWTVVDCCISRPESKAQWETVFATQLEGLPILRVIATHMHPDHIGLASWLCERWSTPERRCQLWVSATDFNVARHLSSGLGGNDQAANFFAAHGLIDLEAQEKIKARSTYFPALVPSLPSSYVRLMDGLEVLIGVGDSRCAWTCISGYGHAPEHIALYSKQLNVLIAGDMVLPRISTNVSVFDLEPEADSLRLFLTSIDKFLPLAENTLVLPSHGKPFVGLHTRIGQLHDHHRDRLAEVVAACAVQPCSAADILPIMFKRELDLHQTTFAMGEALAHLHRLWFAGELQRTLGGDGVYRFESRPRN